jgi:hypothetical protein
MNRTLFALFCVVSVGFNAVVLAVPVRGGLIRPRPLPSGLPPQHKDYGTEVTNQLLEALRDLQMQQHSNFNAEIRDALTDLIWYLLQLTVGAFLTTVDMKAQDVTNKIELSMYELLDVVKDSDAATKEEVRAIVDNALASAVESMKPILEMLDLVLPSITKYPIFFYAPSDVSDVIEALIGKTLEEFLKLITNVFEQIDNILSETIDALAELGEKKPELRAELQTVSDAFFGAGRNVIRYVLSEYLYKVLDSNVTATI